MNPLSFDPAWNATDIESRYSAVLDALAGAKSLQETLEAFAAWDRLRRDVASWKAVSEIRTRQCTDDSDATVHAQRLASAAPAFEHGDARAKLLLIHSPFRNELEQRLGVYAFQRWEFTRNGSDLAVEPRAREAQLSGEYTRLVSSFEFHYAGSSATHGQIGALKRHPQREVRRAALESYWVPFDQNRHKLDSLFDELVKCRTAIARAEGFETYTTLAYRRLGRVDYSPRDVQELRNEIRNEVVPLVQQIHGHDVMPWDEFSGVSTDGAPDHIPVQQLLSDLGEGLKQVHGDLAAFYAELRVGYMDVDDRPAKAPGAFCEFLPHRSMPFVFANATGAPSNLTSIAHEVGHAYQNFSARNYVPLDYIVPTNETGEIHAMALEFLLWPAFDTTFGQAADQFRRTHLRTLLIMLPYIAAVDHFQELVYASPDAAPEDRRTIWRDLEKMYMPWRRDGDIPALCAGGEWQAQRHIYRFPFYYIDYAIAMCCALQIWDESRSRYRDAAERFIRLCAIGGRLPFAAAIREVNLQSPFETGTLTSVARRAAALLIP